MAASFAFFPSRRFLPLFCTQFLGALNDNLLKTAFLVLVSYAGLSFAGLPPEQIVNLAAAVFILPFFLFSATAGRLAERLDKARIARWVKLSELGIMLLAAVGFYTRNVPLLLQLLAWYFILTDLLPAADAALRLGPGIYLSKSGLALPWWGEQGFEVPEIAGFGIEGGASLTPEYLAMLLGLVLYSAAYIAETLRAAVEALPPGQRLAALAMGMTPRQAFLLVLLPQAWRAALPPVTSQLLNLFKNASLAVAIGYPDLVSVAGTSLNQTGRAIECLTIVIAVYLLLSLAAAAVSHRLEARSLRSAQR